MPLALLGGTFDPVHKGHLAIAQAALDDKRFHLDRIIFIPADLPPHKQKQSITSYEDRFAMLELALKDHPRFALSRMEDPTQTQGQPNYSVHTIRRFKKEQGLSTNELYFIVGVDSFLQMNSWREPQAIIAECRLIVAHRPGFDAQKMDALLTSAANNNISLLEAVSVDVSSTQIRQAVAAGAPLENYVPSAVAEYIVAHHLYRSE